MKCLLVVVLLSAGLSVALHARIDHYDTKGFKVYTKRCKTCHGDPYRGAAMKTTLQWRKLFRNDAKKLRELHARVPETGALFEKESFQTKKMKHLRKFLIQSASDSGVVPSCDGNYCGR